MLAFTPRRMVEAELYTHVPTTHGEFRNRTQRVGKGGVSAVNAGNGEGMVFANNTVRALLSVCSQVAIGQVVAGLTLVSRDSGAFEDCQGETWKSTHVNLVGRQTRRRTDRIIVSEPAPGLIPRPGRPRRLLERVSRGGDKVGARSGKGDDAPA